MLSPDYPAGIDPRYGLALYSATIGFFTGGIGGGVVGSFAMGAGISGGLTSGTTSLVMASGEGRQITRKVAKEFYIDVLGMSPQSAYTAASFTVSTAVSVSWQIMGHASVNMRKAMIAQSKLDPANASGVSKGHWSDYLPFKLGGGRKDSADPLAASRSLLGGEQGGQGRLLWWKYEAGSWEDALVETYAGPHDYLNSWFSYNSVTGNIRPMTGMEHAIGNVLNPVNIVIATPFAAAGAAPPQANMGMAFSGLVVDQGK